MLQLVDNLVYTDKQLGGKVSMSVRNQSLDQLAVNTIRTLSIDAIEKAIQAIPACRWVPHLWHMSCGRGI